MAGPFAGYGQVIVIDHGAGYFTLSGYLSALRVKKGDRVRLGAIIGRAGVDPLTARPAVYFEIRTQSRALDPAAWFSRRHP